MGCAATRRRCRGHQRGTPGVKHTIGEQLRHVGGAGKAEQRHHLGLGQQLTRQAHRLRNLVAVVHHFMPNLRAMHAALVVDPVEVDFSAHHHLVPGAGQYPGKGATCPITRSVPWAMLPRLHSARAATICRAHVLNIFMIFVFCLVGLLSGPGCFSLSTCGPEPPHNAGGKVINRQYEQQAQPEQPAVR